MSSPWTTTHCLRTRRGSSWPRSACCRHQDPPSRDRISAPVDPTKWQPAPVHDRRRLNPWCLGLEGHDAFAADCPRNQDRSDRDQRAARADLVLIYGPSATSLDIEKLSPG